VPHPCRRRWTTGWDDSTKYLVTGPLDLVPEEEIPLLLHYAGDAGFSRRELGKYVKADPAAVTRAIQSLTSRNLRQAVQLASSGNYRLTDLGSKRIREQLTDKLLAM
jgi:hypothetical protein